MKLIIAVGELRSHTHVFSGIGLIVLGVLHLTFRRFYARRRKAIHDARAGAGIRTHGGGQRSEGQVLERQADGLNRQARTLL